MKVSRHIAVSAAIGAVLYVATRSAGAAAACLACGVLIDLDHFYDYLVNYGRGIRLNHFLLSFQHDIFRRIFVFFHAWEWVAVIGLIAWRSGWSPVWLGVFTGVFNHMFFDQVVNRHNPAAYFLTYRVLHKFDGRSFYGEAEYRRRREERGKTAQTS